MKSHFSLAVICAGFVTSCQNPKNVIFKASQEAKEVSKLLVIFDDNQYVVSIEDSVVEEGTAHLDGQQLKLVQKPANSLQTFIPSSEFVIRDSELCGMEYVQQRTDSERARITLATKVVGNKDCYKIEIPFKH